METKSEDGKYDIKNVSNLPLGALSKYFKDYPILQGSIEGTRISCGDFLGKGAFGDVYRGVLDGKTEVALKSIRGSDRDIVESLQREVFILSHVLHPSVVTFIGFNGVMHSALRLNFMRFENFFKPHVKALRKYFSAEAKTENRKLNLLFALQTLGHIIKWAFYIALVIPAVIEIFWYSDAKKRLANEWKEISAIEDPRERRPAKIQFVLDKLLQTIIFPITIAAAIVACIANLGAMQIDIAGLFTSVPYITSTLANIGAIVIISIIALPDAIFSFITLNKLFNTISGLCTKIIAAPIAGTVLLVNDPTKSSTESHDYLARKSQKSVTFFKRLSRDPWKTIGQVWESIKTGGLFISCGVNAFGNSGYTTGGSALFQKLGLSSTVADLSAGITGGVDSLSTGVAYSLEAQNDERGSKVTTKSAKIFSQANGFPKQSNTTRDFFDMADYKKQKAISNYFTTDSELGFFAKAKAERNERQESYSAAKKV